MNAARWITMTLVPPRPRRRTSEWLVRTRDGGHGLGVVRWYNPWRKYAFMPREGTLYEEDCLRDIAAFCETETRKQKAAGSAPAEERNVPWPDHERPQPAR